MTYPGSADGYFSKHSKIRISLPGIEEGHKEDSNAPTSAAILSISTANYILNLRPWFVRYSQVTSRRCNPSRANFPSIQCHCGKAVSKLVPQIRAVGGKVWSEQFPAWALLIALRSENGKHYSWFWNGCSVTLRCAILGIGPWEIH